MQVEDIRQTTASEVWQTQPHKRQLLALKDIYWLVYLYPLKLLLSGCPIALMAPIKRFIAPLFRASRARFRDLAMQRMAAAPDLSRRCSPDEFARLFMDNSVDRALDDLVMNKLEKNRSLKCLALHGEDHLQKALATGKGVLLVSGHFYANRLVKRFLSTIGYPILSVRNRHPDDLVAGYFGKTWVLRRYVEFLHSVIRDEVMLQDPECSLKILRRLRAGGLVNLHLDAPLSGTTAFYPFLGTNRKFPTGFLKIARLADCPIIPMLCLGNSAGFTVIFEEPVYIPPEDKERLQASVLMPVLVSRLERQIVEYPDQWELWVRM
jgi:phosphatidylinositol dimannoside acyltransferase